MYSFCLSFVCLFHLSSSFIYFTRADVSQRHRQLSCSVQQSSFIASLNVRSQSNPSRRHRSHVDRQPIHVVHVGVHLFVDQRRFVHLHWFQVTGRAALSSHHADQQHDQEQYRCAHTAEHNLDAFAVVVRPAERLHGSNVVGGGLIEKRFIAIRRMAIVLIVRRNGRNANDDQRSRCVQLERHGAAEFFGILWMGLVGRGQNGGIKRLSIVRLVWLGWVDNEIVYSGWRRL